ncbi:LysR family transcriptional regulator [Nostoc sp. 3335mG]|nr:LysR family transcriptional regulator [Nostoc sp. 3335mG]
MFIEGIDLRHLRYVLLAAEHRSFAKAAARLRIKNVTLRRHISYLERRYEAQLFIRSTRGVTLTEAGVVFIDGAQRVLDEMEGLHEKTRAVAQGRLGSLGLGFITSITAGNLRSSLIAFEEEFPRIQLRRVEAQRQQLLAKLDTGTLDLLIISGSVPYPEVERLSLWSERMLVALPASHPLAARDMVYWSELQGETFLAPRMTADDVEAMVLTRLARPGCPPSIEFTDLTRESTLGIVGAGRGITVVTAGTAGIRVENVVFRELFDGTAPHVLDFSAYWRPGNRNPALHSFLGFLRSRYSLTLPGD